MRRKVDGDGFIYMNGSYFIAVIQLAGSNERPCAVNQTS